MISRALSDEGSQASERRVSSTLAHEAGPCSPAWTSFRYAASYDVQVMFKDEVEFGSQKILCKTDTLGVSAEPGSDSGYDGRWWEFQANMMIGALLLPRSLVISALGQLLSSSSRHRDSEAGCRETRGSSSIFGGSVRRESSGGSDPAGRNILPGGQSVDILKANRYPIVQYRLTKHEKSGKDEAEFFCPYVRAIQTYTALVLLWERFMAYQTTQDAKFEVNIEGAPQALVQGHHHDRGNRGPRRVGPQSRSGPC